jgi:hypothetical protein
MNLEHAAGVGGYIKLGDAEYRCAPLTLEDFAEAQAYLKSRTPDPMEGIAEICNSVHVDVAKVLASEALALRQKWGSLDSDAGLRWVASADGLAFFLFRQTRKYHPELTHEEIKTKCIELEAHVISSVFEKIQDISGLSKNPTQRVKRRPPVKKKKR